MITVGLVNNMPDGALKTTERQFRELLANAAQGHDMRLRLFFLPDRNWSEEAASHLRAQYEPVDRLWSGGPIDGLVVTGTEPLGPALEEEPFWPTLTRIFAWAERHTRSTILSCHAAHAAVRFFDGIPRRALAQKLSGVYPCAKSADHLLLAGGPAAWLTPHSRLNDLPERALEAHGYRILSRSAEAGADIFAAERRCLFLFLQGHPEYDAGALLREYRRDIGRYLSGERDDYPPMPAHYFDAAATERLESFRGRALAARDPGLMTQFPLCAADKDLAHSWREPALRLYANWLAYLA